jgi:hypothetical protein
MRIFIGLFWIPKGGVSHSQVARKVRRSQTYEATMVIGIARADKSILQFADLR